MRDFANCERALFWRQCWTLTTAPCDTQMNTSAFAMVVDSTVIVGSTFENLLMTAPEAKFASDHPCINMKIPG